MTQHIPIDEVFHSFQGEGCHMGKSAFFIRTSGCPIGCPWCDSPRTWKPSVRPKNVEKRDVVELARLAKASSPEIVVITGGEPTIYDLTKLTDELHRYKLPIHLETSGAYDIRGDFDWITVSPKLRRMPIRANWFVADEIKFIIDQTENIEAIIKDEFLVDSIPVWLHPEWSLTQDKNLMNEITEFVKKKGRPFRAGWQVHKCYNAR